MAQSLGANELAVITAVPWGGVFEDYTFTQIRYDDLLKMAVAVILLMFVHKYEIRFWQAWWLTLAIYFIGIFLD